MKIRLIMKRGKREVVIGDFPSQYRAEMVFERLEWSYSWKPTYLKINV